MNMKSDKSSRRQFAHPAAPWPPAPSALFPGTSWAARSTWRPARRSISPWSAWADRAGPMPRRSCSRPMPRSLPWPIPPRVGAWRPFTTKAWAAGSRSKPRSKSITPAKTPNFSCADYEDFRVMLEKEPAIDAILCATPDHLHAYVSVLAMRAGKHVFCEKPLTHNIWEARTVANVAKETGVGHPDGQHRPFHRLACARPANGSGTAPSAPCAKCMPGSAPTAGTRRSPAAHRYAAAARGLNWDLWIGPREPRPYHPAYTPVTWRDFWAFGGGGLGDFGCHDLDAAMWALDLREPTTRRSAPRRSDERRNRAARRDLLLTTFPRAATSRPSRLPGTTAA